jgi:Flp pilus assembly protein TadG
MKPAPRQCRQRGTILVMVALLLFFLLGFIGIALDFGRLFVVKTELQTALDSCALAGAQELDGTGSAIVRASNAGVAAAALNRVNMQTASWGTAGKLTAADITFRDSNYFATTAPAAARYIECARTQNGIPAWLLKMMARTGGSSATFKDTNAVGARAVASRTSAQSACPVPMAIKAKGGGTAPNYGFTVGEWIVLYGNKVIGSGEMGWYNLDGSTSASAAVDQLTQDYCGISVGSIGAELATPGAKSSIATVWNHRFGIYKGSDSVQVDHPDLAGAAYTVANWKGAFNAWDGTPQTGEQPNFLAQRAVNAPFDNTGKIINGNPTIATAAELRQYGYNRRLVTVPVIDGASRVVDFVCMFMLQPLTGPQDDVRLEFRGNASDPSSPCTTNGLAGGAGGPLVPVLVR